ncbi:MAG TPA: hypothetical protein VKV16_08775 [Solirubrobacteraceae bacterium]|nr:hypothetical protein [Solirubrobacteraceae bacterium]
MRRGARTRAWPALARLCALSLVAYAIAGCGGSSSGNGLSARAPARVLAQALAAGTRAATVHVAGSILSGGKPISLNMELVSGKGGAGLVALDGLRLRLVGLDGSLYVAGNDAFYERLAGPSASRRLRGTWLKGPQDAPALRALASLTSLREVVEDALADHGRALTHDGVSRIHGRSAFAIGDLSGDGTVYVAATGVPYPLEIVWTGTRRGKLSFEDWNEPAAIAAPTSSVVDVAQLRATR